MKNTQIVLVVDDDRTIRSGAADALRHAGYTVLEAGSGSQALKVLEEHKGDPVDLLLTDVTMQGMDGGELAEAVGGKWPATRILFMSGFTGGAALHDTVREDGVAFIAKPFVPEALLKKVRLVLKRSP